ncbi:COQ9-domain-containing protein [Myxozyma melibiosi]|uniref:Ubiquinone biosynthesis protein n=1 Tax=Myxozyma melibiosi TaxID=54550 RepID=A0ABR1F485_9ASCO
MFTSTHLRSPVCKASSTILNSARLYHAVSHLPPSPYTPAQARILSSALTHVPEHGFVKDALVLGCRDQGYLDSTHAVFHNGVFDLIQYHLYSERTKLAQHKDKIDAETNDLHERVKRYCVERLKANAPVIKRLPEALAVMGLPPNVPASLEELAKLADEIWYLAGDKSSTFDWYTRRASLSAVYSATELYMTQDNSTDFKNTWEFLDRRLENVAHLKSTLGSSSTWIAFTGMASINLLRSQLARG